MPAMFGSIPQSDCAGVNVFGFGTHCALPSPVSGIQGACWALSDESSLYRHVSCCHRQRCLPQPLKLRPLTFSSPLIKVLMCSFRTSVAFVVVDWGALNLLGGLQLVVVKKYKSKILNFNR